MELDMNDISKENSRIIPIPKDTVNDVAQWSVRCIVCEEGIPIYSPFDHGYKICDKCKRAIVKMREYMKEE